jgi:hypothetical protein
MLDWRNSMAVGTLVHVTTDADQSRVGDCWMKGRLKKGDVLLVLEHSGDNFYDFCLVDVYGNGIRALSQMRFGAYALGELLDWQPTPEDVQSLLNDYLVRTEAVALEVAQKAKELAQANRDALRGASTSDVLRIPCAGKPGFDDFEELIGFVVDNRMDDTTRPGITMTFPHKTMFVEAKYLERAVVLLRATVTA